jgi:type IX secretion system PorP/SprF family membrane protein
MKKISKYLVRIIPLLCLFMLGRNVSAQQDIYYTQWILNPFLVNPAVAGYNGYTTVNIMSRDQWVGIPGSPNTQSVTLQTRILKNSFISRGAKVRKKSKSSTSSGRVGVGAYVYNDRVGLIDRTGFQLTYAYHIPFKTSQLSFGLSLNAYQFKINQSKILVDDPSPDPLVDKARIGIFIPDMNFGTYYTTEKYFVGFSASDLAQSALKISSAPGVDYSIVRNYIFMGGYKIPITSSFARRTSDLDITLEPNALLKVSEYGAVQGDIGCRVLLSQAYWAGISYRTPNIMIFMAGIKIDKFYIGYAFDANFSSIMRSTYGSHELSIAYKFGESVRRYRWLKKTF